MPAGTQANDWFVLAASHSDSTTTTNWSTATVLIDAVMGTGRNAVVIQKITATDIANGYTFTKLTGTGSWRYAISVYRSNGFATIGTATYRGASSTSITASASSISPASGQTVVVIRCEKATNNPGPATASPLTTLRAESYGNATSSPSIWIGDYVAPKADRVFTDPVASANGMGVQLPVIDSVVGTTYTVTVWNGTVEQPATMSYWDGTTVNPVGVSTS
jgi:hypothetical protein